MSSLNLSEIVTTTLRNREKEIANNITNHNALLNRLESKGNIKTAGGGRTLAQPLMYAENSTVKWYSGYDTFTLGAPGEVIDSAEYDWKQLGGFAVISGLEAIKNQGKYAALNYMEARIEVLKESLRNAAGLAMFADGTGTSGKEFGGLQLLVADDPSAAGTVGGIDQQANAFWRNQINDLSAAAATTKDNIRGYMNLMWLNCIRGGNKPDLIVCDANMYNVYEESLQENIRYKDSKMADAGFEAIKYKTADVVYDANCPANHMYFLCSDYLYMQRAPGRWFSVDTKRTIQNADYDAVPVWLAGNLTCSNRSRQGLIVGNVGS